MQTTQRTIPQLGIILALMLVAPSAYAEQSHVGGDNETPFITMNGRDSIGGGGSGGGMPIQWCMAPAVDSDGKPHTVQWLAERDGTCKGVRIVNTYPPVS